MCRLQIAGTWLCPFFFVRFSNGCPKCGCVGAPVTSVGHEDERHTPGWQSRELQKVGSLRTSQGRATMPALDCQSRFNHSQERKINPSLYTPLYFGFSVKCIRYIFPFQVHIPPTEALLCARYPTKCYHMSVPFNLSTLSPSYRF